MAHAPSALQVEARCYVDSIADVVTFYGPEHRLNGNAPSISRLRNHTSGLVLRRVGHSQNIAVQQQRDAMVIRRDSMQQQPEIGLVIRRWPHVYFCHG